MDKIDVSLITDPNVQQPFLGGSLEFLQDAFKEGLSSFLASKHEASNVSFCCLSGIVNSVAAPNANTTGGFVSILMATNVWEVFYVPPTVLTAGGGQVAVLNYDTAGFDAIDPVTFSDGSTHSVHQVRRLKIESAVSGTGLLDLSDIETKRVGQEWDYATYYASAQDYMYFRRDSDNFIHVDAMLNNANPRTLPAGSRPRTAIKFTSSMQISNSGLVFGNVEVLIATNGVITTNPVLGIGAGAYPYCKVAFSFKRSFV